MLKILHFNNFNQTTMEKNSLKVVLFLLLALGIAGQQTPRLPIYLGRGYNIVLGNPVSSSLDNGFEFSVYSFAFRNTTT